MLKGKGLNTNVAYNNPYCVLVILAAISIKSQIFAHISHSSYEMMWLVSSVVRLYKEIRYSVIFWELLTIMKVDNNRVLTSRHGSI